MSWIFLLPIRWLSWCCPYPWSSLRITVTWTTIKYFNFRIEVIIANILIQDSSHPPGFNLSLRWFVTDNSNIFKVVPDVPNPQVILLLWHTESLQPQQLLQQILFYYVTRFKIKQFVPFPSNYKSLDRIKFLCRWLFRLLSTTFYFSRIIKL